MSRNAPVVISVEVIIPLIVGVDVHFFRERFEARLIAKFCVVVLFAGGYFVFLAKH